MLHTLLLSCTYVQAPHSAAKPFLQRCENCRAPLVATTLCAEPDQLVKELREAKSLAELVELHGAHQDGFESMHVGAFWGRVKKLANAERSWLRSGGSRKLRPACQQTAKLLPTMHPQHVAKTARALGKTRLAGRMPWELVWNALPAAAMAKFDEMNPKQLCSTAWAFAIAAGKVELPGAAYHAAPDVFEAVAVEAVGRLSEFNGQDIANLAWAFATASHESPSRKRLFDAIGAEVAARQLDEFKPQEMSNTAWAFAAQGHAAPEMFEAIAVEATKRSLEDFNSQALSNMAWAFAVLDYAPQVGLFESPHLFARRCSAIAPEFATVALLQLHQYSLWCEERGEKWPLLPEALRERCIEAFIATQLRARPSKMQLDVSASLRKLGATVQDEYICEDSGYSIDALVDLGDGVKIAVEVDGPNHFVGDSKTLTGATILKRRQLRHFGWHTVSVAHWEWSPFEWNEPGLRQRKREAYLRRCLDEATDGAVLRANPAR